MESNTVCGVADFLYKGIFMILIPGRENMKQKRRYGMKTRLLLLTILPVSIAVIILNVVANSAMRDGMYTEVLDGLEQLAVAVDAAYGSYDGDYKLGKDGKLYKGTVNLSDRVEEIDGYVSGVEADVTICYGKTRMLTSLIDINSQERAVGTEISEEVWEHVSRGEIYKTSDIQINGKDYCGVYIPTKNGDGTVVGAIFAGKPLESVEAFINKETLKTVGCAITVILLAVVVCVIRSKKIVKDIFLAKTSLDELATGNLQAEVDTALLERGDEIGDMGRAVDNLTQKLRAIVGDLKQSSDVLHSSGDELSTMAGQSSQVADEISRAVEEISKGAVSQAEEIESASHEISTMGQVIENIVDNVGSLADMSLQMSEAGRLSDKTMAELSDSNDKTTEAIAHIGKQIQLTGEAIKKISDSASLITDIADETSLLALNASIESARAGEAGKGFAVVASEIQKLSIQSAEAVSEIQRIIDTLETESEKTMVVMEEAEQLIQEQQAKLDATKSSFMDVSKGIDVSKSGTDEIRSNANSCDTARVQVVDVIANLSAISEQNAASTQETTASMQELNATINLLADAAANLKGLSESLNNEMSFFKI